MKYIKEIGVIIGDNADKLIYPFTKRNVNQVTQSVLVKPVGNNALFFITLCTIDDAYL